MIAWPWLLLIVPLSMLLGFGLCALLTAGSRADDAADEAQRRIGGI